jgi:hypothetical protein
MKWRTANSLQFQKITSEFRGFSHVPALWSPNRRGGRKCPTPPPSIEDWLRSPNRTAPFRVARSHQPSASNSGNRTGRLWVLILGIGSSCTHREELPRSVNPKLSQGEPRPDPEGKAREQGECDPGARLTSIRTELSELLFTLCYLRRDRSRNWTGTCRRP